MGKYLSLWELDMNRVPEDPKKQLELFTKLQNMVKEDLKNGIIKDFGIFLGGDAGYSIVEGTDEQIAMFTMKYAPFVKCKIQSAISIEQIDEIMKKIRKYVK